jgi:glutamyl-tRNA reductase
VNEAPSVPFVALVTHARHVPAIEREQFAAALQRESAGRVFVLETCHRVEAYLGNADDAARLAPALPDGARTLTGEQAVHHAITVAVGRDSVVVGEDQILHQLRVSVDAARAAGTLDPALERLFALALQAGRRARSWRQGPPRSLADVALASIERRAGPIRGRDLLVVGAGRMGRLAARAAVAAGARVAVANRSADGAEALAAAAGVRIERFDPEARIGGFAGVVVALAGPWPIGAAAMDALARSATVVVDLSVPAAVPGGLAEILGRRLVTADDLALGDVGTAAQDGSAARLDSLVDRSTAEFVAWLKGRDGRAAAEALVRRADCAREAELAALWRRLPHLDPETRDAIEGMTGHLADRLLREPLERLGRDTDGRDGQAIRDIFSL